MHEWWHFQEDIISCYHTKVLSALEERGMPAPPSLNNTPCSTRFSISILPPKKWPCLNLPYLTEVSRITAFSSLPACQNTILICAVGVLFPASADCLWDGTSAPVTSSKRPTAARYCTDYYNRLALKWLWNLTASGWNRYYNPTWRCSLTKRNTVLPDVEGQSPTVSPLFSFHLCKSQSDSTPLCKMISWDKNEPAPSASKSACLITFKAHIMSVILGLEDISIEHKLSGLWWFLNC